MDKNCCLTKLIFLQCLILFLSLLTLVTNFDFDLCIFRLPASNPPPKPLVPFWHVSRSESVPNVFSLVQSEEVCCNEVGVLLIHVLSQEYYH